MRDRHVAEDSLQESLDRLARQDEERPPSEGLDILPGTSSGDAGTGATGRLFGVTQLLRGRWVWILAAVLAGVVVLALSALGAVDTGFQDGTAPVAPSAGTTTEPSQEPSATGTQGGATGSPLTSSAAPSASGLGPTRDQVAAARAEAATSFGTFTPFTRTGNGGAVFRLPAEVRAGWVFVRYTGSGAFELYLLGTGPGSTGVGVSSYDGAYEGSLWVGVDPNYERTSRVEVVASGPWTMTIAPVSTAPAFTPPLESSSRGVFLYAGGGPWTASTGGDGLFGLTFREFDGTVSATVFETSGWSGPVGPAVVPGLVEVLSDGYWSVAAG